MLFQRINRTDAEKVFSVLQNVQASTISQGAIAVLDITSSVNGVRVSQAAAATLGLAVGVAAESVADSAFGKFQVYGFNSQVYVTNSTNNSINAGDVLIAVASANHLASLETTAATGANGFFYAAEDFVTATTPAVAQKKAWIRAL